MLLQAVTARTCITLLKALDLEIETAVQVETKTREVEDTAIHQRAT